MKVKCKVCGEWFEKENVYCDHCAAKYGAERSNYDIDLFEDQRSYSAGDQAKADKKQARKDARSNTGHNKDKQAHEHTEETIRLPDFDTLKDLKIPFEGRQKKQTEGRQKSPFGAIKSIIFFMVFMNIITGVFRSIDLSDFGDLFEEFTSSDDISVTEEVVVENEEISINNRPEFPMNPSRDYTGELSPIDITAEGVYEGTLSTATYINYDTKHMRFDLKDENFSGQYETPVYISVSKGLNDIGYYFDVWDQSTLKMLGTYTLDSNAFSEGSFIGNPEGEFYDDPDMDDLKANYDGIEFEGRLALPYTIENDVNYFNLEAKKINDDPSLLARYTFWENEYSEDFISENSDFSITFYTYETAQGYPHSSMYYDGVFAITDGEITYPTMPFYLSDDGNIYAYMDYMDTETLTIRDADFDEYHYYDEVDTQLYRYYPIQHADSIYTLEFIGQVYSDDNDQTHVDGTFHVTGRSDGLDNISKDFSTIYIDAN